VARSHKKITIAAIGITKLLLGLQLTPKHFQRVGIEFPRGPFPVLALSRLPKVLQQVSEPEVL
jgi:hypothetical protein